LITDKEEEDGESTSMTGVGAVVGTVEAGGEGEEEESTSMAGTGAGGGTVGCGVLVLGR